MPVAPAAAGFVGYAVGVGFQYQLRGRARAAPDPTSRRRVSSLIYRCRTLRGAVRCLWNLGCACSDPEETRAVTAVRAKCARISATDGGGAEDHEHTRPRVTKAA